MQRVSARAPFGGPAREGSGLSCRSAGKAQPSCELVFLTGCDLQEHRPKLWSFLGQLNEHTKGLIGFLHDFREAGQVDVGYVDYVFRANENLACYLLNGIPPLIDVDDTKILETNGLERNIQYAALKARYPKIAIWPSDRSTTMYPIARELPTDGKRFVVSYWLQNGCHACERIGSVQFAFDFDKTGKFLGTQFQSVEGKAGTGQRSTKQ